MRKLNLSDAFKLARIIKTADIKSEMSNLAGKYMTADSKSKNLNEIGIEVFLTLISAAGDSKVEEKIYDFLAGVKECTPEEIKNLSLDGLKEVIKAIVEENELRDFFKYASGLM